MSFRDNRFLDWRGNHHLCGDVNFDGFVNLEDLEMIRRQLGNTADLEWGTGDHQYNPNADLNRNGVIDEGDLALAESYFGEVSPWYCRHPNPSMINGGEGWTINDCWTANTYNPAFAGIALAKTEFIGRGFKHRVHLSSVAMGYGCFWTEVDFTPNAHFSFNPNWRKVQDSDIPISDLPDHEFVVEHEIVKWTLWTKLGDISPKNYYAGAYFGGWIILDEPYEVYGHTYEMGMEVSVYLGESNILETMFALKQEDGRVSFTPGGDNWHRMFYIPGPGIPPDYSNGWYILQYIIDDPELNQGTVNKLNGEKILSLLKTIDGKELIDRHPVTPLGTIIWTGYKYFSTSAINIKGAFFRPVYVSLEGAIDGNVTDTVVDCEQNVYGAYHYVKRKKAIWRPTLSRQVEISVT